MWNRIEIIHALHLLSIWKLEENGAMKNSSGELLKLETQKLYAR